MKYRSTCYSEDGSIKYVFDVPAKGWHQKIAHGKREVSIENALLHVPYRENRKPEYVLCLSSQAGCIYRCLMCANMLDSFYGCLTPEEIDEQIRLTLSLDGNLEKVKSKGIVEFAFMAIGDPLYGNNVVKFIQEHEPFVEDTRFSLSTIGAPGSIDKLTDSKLPYPVRLELLLHFSNDILRNEWLLIDGWWFKEIPELNISKMLDEAERYAQKYPGKITLNYVLIDGINNMDHNIEQLSNLLKHREDVFYVKLMRPNLTSAFVFSWGDVSCFGIKKPSKWYSPKEFEEKLLEAGIPVTLFESKGTDIAAGCGMMTTRFRGKKGVVLPEELEIPQADPSKIGF